jgi:Domain of unknown function (DUF5919)
MPEAPTWLKRLLLERHWQTYATFCVEYDNAARRADTSLLGTYPSRAQYQRWLSGNLKSMPHPHHCRILEQMFPGWTATRLFERSDSNLPNPAVDSQQTGSELSSQLKSFEPKGEESRYLDLIAVYATRAEFTSKWPTSLIFQEARTIKAAGLSLNLICQQYPDQMLKRSLVRGCQVECFFLRPDGHGTASREVEENYEPGELAALTEMNIRTLLRTRERLEPSHQGNLRIATYDEIIRFNIYVIDGHLCITQPYLPDTRGLDSPTFILEKDDRGAGGLFDIFAGLMDFIEERSEPR